MYHARFSHESRTTRNDREYRIYTKGLYLYDYRYWFQFMYTVGSVFGVGPEEQRGLSVREDRCEREESKLEPMKTSRNLHWSLTVSSFDEGEMQETLMPRGCRKWGRSGGQWRSSGPGCYPRPTRWASKSATICVHYDRASLCTALLSLKRTWPLVHFCLPNPTQNVSYGPWWSRNTELENSTSLIKSVDPIQIHSNE